MGFQISVKNLSVVAVLYGKTDLGEPIEYLVFREWPTSSFLDFLLKISIISMVHYYAEFSPFRFVDLTKLYYIWMDQLFQYFCLSNRCLPFLSRHFRNIHLFNHQELLIFNMLNQKSFSKGSLSNEPNLSINIHLLFSAVHFN